MNLSNLSDRGTLKGSLMYSIEDYNILANKPQINGNELVGNKTGHDLGLANLDDIIYVEANPAGIPSEDLTKLQVGDVIYNIAGQIVYGEASGAVASFDDGGDNKPLQTLKVAIAAQQASGIPSPSNPLPISGWNSAEIHRADGATPHIIDDTYNITWSEAGEVFGGYLTITNGEVKLTKTYSLVTYNGSETWAVHTSSNGFYIRNTNMKIGALQYGKCNRLPIVYSSASMGVALGSGSSNNIIYVYHITDNISGVTDMTTWKTWLSNNNLQVYYPLANQVTYDLTPTQINTLLGDNNIWSDTGNITECVYQRDLNIVINKILQQ